MHELSIARSVMQIVRAEAQKAHAKRVIKVSLLIGDLTGILPDSLSFCFDLVSRETVAEGATFAIERVPIRGHCARCDKSFVIDDNR